MIRHNNYRPSSPEGFDAASAFELWMHRAVAFGERRRMIRSSMKFNNVVCAAVALASAILPTPCHAKVTFANVASTFLMPTANAKFCVRNPAKITGWGQRSIVEAYGNNQSSAWPEGYTSGSIIGQSGLVGVTLPMRTNLVEANSNAINVSLPLLRTTSNLLLYTARTYSSSLFVLRSRADSTALNVRYTANAANYVTQLLAVPTTDSIDGTQFMRYHTLHHVFHNNGIASTVRGWVRFNDGFTVMPRASVIMDTLTTVSGGFDLRDTGTLILNNDLYLAHNVTLTNGGNIKGESSMTSGGQANTIFMGGDLTLSATTNARTLHITGDWGTAGNSGDLVIDGCGHTLSIEDRAQIFVDQNVTLTLRNMTIRTGPKSLMVPAIRLASSGSKLALDNVMFDLGADFQFKQGQIFVHDEVAVTGTSAFIYQSPMPSYITSGATWSFEQGTTFSVAPATYTDIPFTAGTVTSNNFIVPVDASAALSLGGCSFKTTFTGLRLRTGMVLFDNKVAIDTQAGVNVSGLGSGSTLLTAGTVYEAAVSPNGMYVATNSYVSSVGYVNVYKINGTSLTLMASDSSFTPAALTSLSWSPDGRFIAAGVGQGTRIYRFNGKNLTIVDTQAFLGGGTSTIEWSPDGRYVAVGAGFNTYTLAIYRFDGTALRLMTTLLPYGSPILAVNGLAWHPSGKYLLIAGTYQGGRSGNFGAFYIYSFDGKNLTYINNTDIVPTGYTVAWSPDGRFFAYGTGVNSGVVGFYRFNGTSSYVSLGTQTLGYVIYGIQWGLDGRYAVVTGQSTGSVGQFALYNVSLSGVTQVQSTSFGSLAYKCVFSPDNKYVLISGTNGASPLVLYPLNFVSTSVSNQSFSNGLVFGDKAKGAAYDADVQVLGSATVKINGMVKDDSA